MELVIIDMENLEIICHQLIMTKNLKNGQLLVFYLLPMLPNKIPLKIFGYNLKIFYESIGIYVSLLRSSNFCLSFSPRNINLISPKFISTPIQRKSFRIAIAAVSQSLALLHHRAKQLCHLCHLGQRRPLP